MKMFLQITITLLAVLQGAFSDECTTNFDQTEVTCETNIGGEQQSITIKLDTCRKEPKITFKIKALGIDWEKDFDSSQSVPIPGLTYAGNGLYLNVEIRSEPDGRTYLKMDITMKVLFVKFPPVKLIDEYIGKTGCNEFLYWWNSQTDAVKGASAGGAGLFLILLIVCCCKCCCCKKKEQPGTTFVMAPPTTSPGNIIVQNSTQQQQQTYLPPTNQMGNNPYMSDNPYIRNNPNIMSDNPYIRNNPDINDQHKFNYQKLNNEL